MQAIVCREFGPPDQLVLTEVADPIAGDGEVVIAVEACSVNFPTLLIIQNLYQTKLELPFIPGTEVAGFVSSVGPGVTDLAVGDRVFAPTSFGGLAQRVAVRASQAIPVPDGMDSIHASALLYAFGTSQHALRDRAALRPGETLLVLGAAGGVGLAAVELGAQMGATVIAAASTAEKLQLCVDRGATHGINYVDEDLKARVRELTDGRGADVVYDAVGGEYAEPALRSVAWEGRYLVVGFAAGDIPRIPLNLPLLKGCSIIGVFWGSFCRRNPERHRANVDELMQWWREGRIQPHISAVYPLDRAADAISSLGDRTAMGKVVVQISQS